jgi:acyl carrier protein
MDAKEEVLSRLETIIREHLGIEEEKITEKSTWAQLGADSLDRLEMSQVLEDAFDVSIPHVVGERLNTVGETVEHLLILTAMRRTISK